MSTRPQATPSGGPALRHARLLFLVLVAVGLLVFAFLSPGTQGKIGLTGAEGWFIDTYAILASSDAVQAGQDPSQPNPLDVYGRPHSYSGWWFALGSLGFTRDHTPFIGGLMVCLFFLAMTFYLQPRSRWQAGLGALALLSPVVLLAVNRANNDLVVLVVLVGGLLTLKEGGPWRLTGFGAAVLLATGLKFYPLLATVGLLAVRPSRSSAWALAGTALGSGVVLAGQWEWFRRAIIPLPEGVYLFGAGVWWREWGLTGWALPVVTLFGLGLGARWLSRRGWCQGLATEDEPLWIRAGFAAGAALLLGCWLAGTSFAYRWVFALLLLPWLWRRDIAGDRSARVTGGLLLVCLWLDGLFSLAMNIFILPRAAASLGAMERVWQVATQPLVWALMMLCAGWLWDLSAARLREMRLPRLRWPQASPRWLMLLLVLGGLVYVQSDRLRLAVGLPNSETWFLDSYAVLAASDAHQAGLDAAAIGHFDPLGRPHRYSDWWYALGAAGVTRDDNFIVGLACIIAAVAAIAFTVRPGSWKEIGWTLLVLLSPGVFLGFNRANNDLVVFALLGAALVALQRSLVWRHALAAVAVALAAGLKFYPVVAALPLCWFHVRAGRWKTAGASAAAVGVALLAVWPQMMRGRFPVEVSVHVWGAQIWPQDLGGGSALMIGLLALALAAAFVLAGRSGSGRPGSAEDAARELALMMGGTVLLACFVAGMNYGYRWIFAIWLGPWLYLRGQDQSQPEPVRALAGFLWIMVPVVLWLDGLLCLAANTGGLIAVGMDHGQLQLGWRLLTQPLTWVMMTLLAGALLVVLRQTWRRIRS